MRKILLFMSLFFCVMVSFAQKDVTKFLGFPVDGTKEEMIENLKSKGFKLNTSMSTEYLTGRFNGSDVQVFIGTENGKVCRIMVCDDFKMNESDIRIRFNKLCKQFEENGKYLVEGDYTIPENEDISIEMGLHNKRYEAVFYQVTQEEFTQLNNRLKSSIDEIINSKYSSEQLEAPTKEIEDDILKIKVLAIMEAEKYCKSKSVWFKISGEYGRYYISMFYDNEYNRANGEDL